MKSTTQDTDFLRFAFGADPTDEPRVRDVRDGVWWPDESAMKEIVEADDPEATAMRICDEEPHRGTWHA